MIERVDSEVSPPEGAVLEGRLSAPGRMFGPSADPWGELERYKQRMRRFAQVFASLPVSTQATCPDCGKVVDASFQRARGQIVLTYHCPSCPPRSEVHADAIWTHLESDFPGSARETFCGSRIHPVLRRLPRTVESLCPECSAIIVGRHFVRDGAVWIEKTCPQHGYFRDCINSDALLYSKAAWWTYQEHAGQQFPQVKGGKNCPSDCGLCNQHLSGSCLAQIDLTNRCNMRCPICFANANAAGFVCEVDYDQVVRQLQTLRDLRPIPCTAIQFTGGEPTIHGDFLKIISTARDMGFSHIQIATNGIRLAELDFARAALAAGLHTLYLQFDGVGEEPYRTTRNYPGIWQKKLAVVENCRKTGMKICLVPTILKGVNDSQVGEIFRFAVANIDVVQRHQLPAGLLHRPHGGPGPRPLPLHAGRPGPRNRQGQQHRSAARHVPPERGHAAVADSRSADRQAQNPPHVPPRLRLRQLFSGLTRGQGVRVPAGHQHRGHVRRDEPHRRPYRQTRPRHLAGPLRARCGCSSGTSTRIPLRRA